MQRGYLPCVIQITICYCLIDWPKNHHFKIFKLEIENIFLIDWFGGPKPISPSQYLEFGRWACKKLKIWAYTVHLLYTKRDFFLSIRSSALLQNHFIWHMLSIYSGIRAQWCPHKRRMLQGSICRLCMLFLKMKSILHIL